MTKEAGHEERVRKIIAENEQMKVELREVKERLMEAQSYEHIAAKSPLKSPGSRGRHIVTNTPRIGVGSISGVNNQEFAS